MQTRTVGLHPCLSDAAGLGLKKVHFFLFFFKFFFFFFTKNFFFDYSFHLLLFCVHFWCTVVGQSHTF